MVQPPPRATHLHFHGRADFNETNFDDLPTSGGRRQPSWWFLPLPQILGSLQPKRPPDCTSCRHSNHSYSETDGIFDGPRKKLAAAPHITPTFFRSNPIGFIALAGSRPDCRFAGWL